MAKKQTDIKWEEINDFKFGKWKHFLSFIILQGVLKVKIYRVLVWHDQNNSTERFLLDFHQLLAETFR